MQWISYHQLTHPQEYWNASLKKAELELKQRHHYEIQSLKHQELNLAYSKFEADQANFYSQLSAQRDIARMQADTDIEVANIRSAHEMDLAHFNANAAMMVAEVNGRNNIVQEAIRGNSAIGVEMARGQNALQLAVANNIFSMLNQSYSALLNEMAEESKHERVKELMNLKAQQETEAKQLASNLSAIKSYLDSELSKAGLEHSKQCEIIADLVKKAVGLGVNEFSKEEIRQAVNKMMREAEPYTGY